MKTQTQSWSITHNNLKDHLSCSVDFYWGSEEIKPHGVWLKPDWGIIKLGTQTHHFGDEIGFEQGKFDEFISPDKGLFEKKHVNHKT